MTACHISSYIDFIVLHWVITGQKGTKEKLLCKIPYLFFILQYLCVCWDLNLDITENTWWAKIK